MHFALKGRRKIATQIRNNDRETKAFSFQPCLRCKSHVIFKQPVNYLFPLICGLLINMLSWYAKLFSYQTQLQLNCWKNFKDAKIIERKKTNILNLKMSNDKEYWVATPIPLPHQDYTVSQPPPTKITRYRWQKMSKQEGSSLLTLEFHFCW